jgi:hypothetical protein
VIRRPSLALLALALSACSIEEDGVLLEASLSSPELSVEATALTTEVSGSFGIELSLGDRASDPTTVKLGVFSLKRADRELSSPLNLDSDPKFPLDVGVGSSKHVAVLIDEPEGDPELAVELCAGPLEIAGTFTDTLGGDRPVSVSSGSFQPSCP